MIAYGKAVVPECIFILRLNRLRLLMASDATAMILSANMGLV
jgi:hypothetical protein